MRRILNLNDFSAKALAWIGIIGLACPAGLWLLEQLLRALQISWHGLEIVRWGLLGVGALLLALFLLVVILEQIQDHWLYQRYLRSRRKRIPGPNGLSECPYCGNRQLRDFQPVCPVCGKRLE